MNSSQEHKKTILVLTSRFPYPLDKGDKLRIFHQIKELSKRNKIILFAVSDKKITDQHKHALSTYCSEIHVSHLSWFSRIIHVAFCLINKHPFQTGYFYNASVKIKLKKLIRDRQIDHIYCQLIRMSEYVKHVHHIPKTLDYMDALSEGIRKRIPLQKGFKKLLFKSEAKRLKLYEQKIFDYFENLTMISEQDKTFISHPDQNRIVCVPNGVDESFFVSKTTSPDHEFVFIGNMSYPPNISAVKYIATEILPHLPESRLLISGADPAKELVGLANSNPQLTLTGWVEDIRESYARGAIFLAPMTIGTGQQNKILEAMAIGIPVITTSLCNNAIHADHSKHLFVANSPDEFISIINEINTDPVLREKVIREAKDFIQQNYSWSKTTSQLEALFQ